MTTRSNEIFVPAPEAGAFNPKRAAGKLLQAQALHLRDALLHHQKELTAVLAVDLGTLKTEADVSAYIHRATALLHTHARAGVRK